jgi:hypothetical protein
VNNRVAAGKLRQGMEETGQLKSLAKRFVDRAAFEVREWAPPARDGDYQRFVILSPGRTGSGMLVQRCESHPQIRCYGEVLGVRQIGWQTPVRSQASRRALNVREKDVVRFLRHHVWHRYRRGIRAVGFKLLYAHLTHWYGALQPLIAASPDLKFVWLERRNSLEIYLSHLNARKTRVFAVHESEPLPRTVPVTIDPDHFRKTMHVLDATRDAMARSLRDSQVLKLCYEDLVAQAHRCNGAICEFLGVAVLPLRHNVRKMAQGSLRERVANFDALRDEFRSSRWESCFAEY